MQALQGDSTLQGGKYRIIEKLGQGGFGITYLAENTLLLGKVAIKEFFFKEYCDRDDSTSRVTIPTSGNREIVERFKQKFIKEARTIFSLNHPNIVRILDVFEENGTAYYVMDYIEGESLGDMVKRRGAIPEAEALGYVKDAASALEYIHSKNINHLDIKPSNLVLRHDDGKVLVIDFGVAKQYDAVTSEGTTTTPVGISHGYSPAEQYRKNGVQAFSPQSDVYSLAATLFKLLTGNTPPEAMEIQDEGLPVAELQAKHIPSTVISAIAMAMKGRHERTQSVELFIANLQKTEDSFNVVENQQKTENIQKKEEARLPSGDDEIEALKEAEAQAMAEARAKVAAARKAREEAERKAREEAERKAEKERKAREEAERKIREAREKAEAERKAREEAEIARKAREEAERKAREEVEQKAREEAARIAHEVAIRKAREEAEAKVLAQAKAMIEAERKAREAAEAKAAEAARKAEAEREAREQAERIAREKAEAERVAREEAARIAREKAETERKVKAEAERRALEDAKRKVQEARMEAARIAREKAETERKVKAEAERRALEDAKRKVQEARMETERVAREETARIAREKAETERKVKVEAERRALEDAKRKVQEARMEAERKAKAEAARKVSEMDNGKKKGAVAPTPPAFHQDADAVTTLPANETMHQDASTAITSPAEETNQQDADTVVTPAAKETTRPDAKVKTTYSEFDEVKPKSKKWVWISLIAVVVAGIAIGIYASQYYYGEGYAMPQDSIAFGSTDSVALRPTSVENEEIVLNKGHETKRRFVYSGEVDEEGLPDGVGKAYYHATASCDSCVFEGTFVHGITSEGEMRFTNGNSFKGTFTEEGYYKQGTWVEKDGYYFEGTFKEGVTYNGSWFTPKGKKYSKVVNGKFA